MIRRPSPMSSTSTLRLKRHVVVDRDFSASRMRLRVVLHADPPIAVDVPLLLGGELRFEVWVVGQRKAVAAAPADRGATGARNRGTQ